MGSTNDESVIRVRDLRKRYGDTVALDGVSLTVEDEEIFGLLGPNGAGKSTLMKILTTITEPTGGTASVNGIDVRESPAEVRQQIGYIPQYTALDEYLTGRQALRLFAKLYKTPADEIDERIGRALETVDLADRSEDLIDTYSGGMKRRLEIATGLVHEPDVVIFDEPTLGLDPSVRHEMWEYILEIRRTGSTVLMATHYLTEADKLCDRVAIIDDGRIRTVERPDTLKANVSDGEGGTLDQAFLEITELEPQVV